MLSPSCSLLQVSPGSGFRFANKKMTTRPDILRPRGIPSDPDELVNWVKGKHSVITSYTDITGGQIVSLDVGRGEFNRQFSNSMS